MSHLPLAGAAGAPEFAALAELTDAVRALMEAASSTTMPEARMHSAAAEIRTLAGELAAGRLPRVHKIRLLAEHVERVRDGEPWQAFPFNVQGIPFVVRVEADRGWADFIPGPLHEGPPDLLHGGFSAAIIDAFLGTLVQVALRPSVTATLELRYRGPVLLEVPTRIEGRVLKESGRKVVAECAIKQGGAVLVEATGLFVAVSRADSATSQVGPGSAGS